MLSEGSGLVAFPLTLLASQEIKKLPSITGFFRRLKELALNCHPSQGFVVGSKSLFFNCRPLRANLFVSGFFTGKSRQELFSRKLVFAQAPANQAMNWTLINLRVGLVMLWWCLASMFLAGFISASYRFR